ncbi:hypothetical protein B0T24DRAFT_716268 [Lasiosphaeria ovina]|uniref:Ankyrin repeat protein n=1 Tax=Lasiosphaeria ovina TaxID=92902 RepID=A0AAE0NN63_9PEZI|nr:hypothetical protein B0T24DRAFT_716268 [Lasiosphaeria ovina]
MPPPSVSAGVQQCARLLSKARSDDTLNRALRLELENALARLKIWAGNVGAFAPGNASVDYRLREDSDVADVIISMLNSLRTSLERVINPPLVEEVEEEEEEKDADRETKQETESVSSGKTASTHSSSALSLDSEATGSEDGTRAKTDKRHDSGSEDALEKANTIITRLYQLASVVRKPESSSENAKVRDFMTKLKFKGETFDMEDAEDHARSHLLARFPNAPPFLVHRLVSAVVFRRMKLRYRQRHQDKLRQGIDDSFDPELQLPGAGHSAPATRPVASAAPASDLPGGQQETRGAATLGVGKAQQPRPSRTIFSATNASSVNRQQFPSYARSTALSGITLSAVSRRQKLDVPTPPKNIDEALKRVECPFCMRIISSEERKEPRWTRHILRDIDPYVCLFEHCDQENTLFKTQEEWLGHMQWQHTVVWACQVRGHEFAIYDSPGELEHHIRSEHPASFTEIQLPVLIQESASPAPDTFALLTASLAAECQTDSPTNIGHECPICQKKFHQRTSEEVSSGDGGEGDVQNHVLYHLESVALLSLPIDDKRTSDSAGSNRLQSSANREALVEDGDDLPAVVFSDSHSNPSESDDFSQSQEDASSGHELSRLAYDGRWGEIFRAVKQPGVPQPDEDRLLLEWRQEIQGASSKSELSLPDDDLLQQTKAEQLIKACITGDTNTMVKLLEENADIETKVIAGQTPLSWAAENGHEAVVNLLLERGANIETKDTKFGRTPLICATERGHEAVVKLLLERGANIETKDTKLGQTPLSWAAANGHEAVVKVLLEKNADIERKDIELGQTPLSWAAENGHEAVVKLLLEKNADIETKDTKFGRTPLTWATRYGHGAVMKLLQNHVKTEI